MEQIRNKAEYETIMQRINELVELVDDNTPQTDRNYIELDFLTDSIVAYEKEHSAIGKSTLSAIIKF